MTDHSPAVSISFKAELVKSDGGDNRSSAVARMFAANSTQ